MKNKLKASHQRQTTLKWDTNGNLSSIDMARIINTISVQELKECKLTCLIPSKDRKLLNLGMWW